MALGIFTTMASAKEINKMRNPFCFASSAINSVPAAQCTKKTVEQNKKKCAEIVHNDQRKMVSVGDKLGEWEIADIFDDTVVLRNKHGQMHTLSIQS